MYCWLGVMSLAEVRLQEAESLENTLRRCKRKVQTEDIIKEINNLQMPQEIWPI
jgi:lambda repressor-like predicted transcriptional regulator